MKRYTMLASALMMSTMLAAGAAQAKTLVYCSEGSPEDSTPAFIPPARPSMLVRPVYNQLVEFERGTTNVDPGPCRKLGSFRRRSRIHLPSAQGRQVSYHRLLHPDARLQRR